MKLLVVILVSVYLAVIKAIKLIIINCPEWILLSIKPRARMQVARTFESDSEEQEQVSVSEEFKHIARKVDNTVPHAKPVNGFLDVDILYAATFNDLRFPDHVETKIAMWSRVDKVTIDTILTLSNRRYFLMECIDANGYVHRTFIDLYKKKNLITKTDILFSRISIDL